MGKVDASRYLARALREYGLTHVFMVPTIAVSALAEMDSLGIVGVSTHGEKAAAYMADGYARAVRSPGVCMAQHIGAANLVAGLRDAYMACSPVIALTGGPSPLSRYRHEYQEIEDFSMYDAVTKFNCHVDDVRRLPDLLRQAFRTATSGAPGPVHLEVPMSIGVLLNAELDDSSTGPYAEQAYGRTPATRPLAEQSSIEKALQLLEAAKRPIIVAGGGVRWSDAGEQLFRLARKLGIPVATSLNAKGTIDETDPLSVGVVGIYSRASANRAVEAADLVFFVGSHTGGQVTNNWTLPGAGTHVIQLDIDAAELGRNYPNSVSLHGDARITLERMDELAPTQGGHADWLAIVAGFVDEWRREHEAVLSSSARPTRPERLCREVTRFLADDGILVVDTGHAGIWCSSMIDIRPGQTFLRSAGSLGWAFPAALGAKAASPDRMVACFTGDGGMYYHLAELETAARHGLNVVIVVNNNRSLSQDMKIFQHAWGGHTTPGADRMWQFTEVDLAAVARNLGCGGIRVVDPNDLQSALHEARRAGRPTLVDVVTDFEVLPDPPYGGIDFYGALTRASAVTSKT